MLHHKSARLAVVFIFVFAASLINVNNAMAVTAITDAVRMIH
jgi:hypothetical protein